MSATPDDGGPAFPHNSMDEDAKIQSTGGMSLRDHFEVKFSAAWVIALSARKDDPGYSDEGAIHEACRLGTLHTKTMLEARKRK